VREGAELEQFALFAGGHHADAVREVEGCDAGAEAVLVSDADVLSAMGEEKVFPAREVDVSGDVLIAG
jgi:hypothetical protein